MLKKIILKHLCHEICDDQACKDRAIEIANNICKDYTQHFLGSIERDADGNTIFSTNIENVTTTQGTNDESQKKY